MNRFTKLAVTLPLAVLAAVGLVILLGGGSRQENPSPMLVAPMEQRQVSYQFENKPGTVACGLQVELRGPALNLLGGNLEIAPFKRRMAVGNTPVTYFYEGCVQPGGQAVLTLALPLEAEDLLTVGRYWWITKGGEQLPGDQVKRRVEMRRVEERVLIANGGSDPTDYTTFAFELSSRGRLLVHKRERIQEGFLLAIRDLGRWEQLRRQLITLRDPAKIAKLQAEIEKLEIRSLIGGEIKGIDLEAQGENIRVTLKIL